MSAEAITAALGGIWHNGYGNSPCPAHGNRSAALTIKDDPTKAQGIYVKCHAGCDFRAVLAALETLKLISGDHGPAPAIDPEIVRKKQQQDAERRRKGQRAAAWLWDIANPAPSPMTVARYLLARGIDLGRAGGIPACLRFAPQAKHFGSNIELPAMVAAISGPDGGHVATHLTFLNGACSGKAALDPDKIIIGNPNSGAIRLFPMPSDGVLGLAEGIESALSAAELTGLPVWSTANASVMGNFEPPAGMTHALIFADHDAINKGGYRAGQRAAEKLARRLTQQSIGWEIRYPADGLKDFNDELKTRKRAGRAA